MILFRLNDSSANNLIPEKILAVMSFMYNKNIVGPHTVPSGTPEQHEYNMLICDL